MKDDHYLNIVEKVKPFIGKIDGDDFSEIAYWIDDYSFDVEFETYRELVEDLLNCANAMWCEYGIDYGSTRKWEEVCFKILIEFKGGYTKNVENLNRLLEIIFDGIEG